MNRLKLKLAVTWYSRQLASLLLRGAGLVGSFTFSAPRGENKETQFKHIENINDMIGKDRIFD